MLHSTEFFFLTYPSIRPTVALTIRVHIIITSCSGWVSGHAIGVLPCRGQYLVTVRGPNMGLEDRRSFHPRKHFFTFVRHKRIVFDCTPQHGTVQIVCFTGNVREMVYTDRIGHGENQAPHALCRGCVQPTHRGGYGSLARTTTEREL